MDFALSPKATETSEKMWDFMRSHVFPAEPVWAAYLREHGDHAHPPIMEELKAEAPDAVGCGTSFCPSSPASPTWSTPPSPRSRGGPR